MIDLRGGIDALGVGGFLKEIILKYVIEVSCYESLYSFIVLGLLYATVIKLELALFCFSTWHCKLYASTV